MKNLFLSGGLLLILTLTCSFVDSGARSRTETEILNVLMEQQKAWNNGDIEGYMQGYWESDSLRFASGNRVTFGWTKTLENYKKAYPDKSSMGILAFTEIDIKVIDENSAIAFGRWKLKRKNDEPNGLFTLVFKLKGEEWRIVHDHSSAGR